MTNITQTIVRKLKPADINRPLAAYRLVQFAILISLFWKWRFFLEANLIYATIPVGDPFFPDWLRSIDTLRIAFWTLAVATAISLTSHELVATTL